MATLNDVFPSRFLKAEVDVCDGEDMPVTIKAYDKETFGQGREAQEKYYLKFRETDKGLVLNKVNGATIAKLLGSDDLDDWIGKQIVLFSTQVQFGPDMVDSIRVRNKAPKPKAKPAKVTQQDADEASREHARAAEDEDEANSVPF